MSDDPYGEDSPEESLLESVHKTPDDPLMGAALHFDRGLDDMVAGAKKLIEALDPLQEELPQPFKEIREKLFTGLLPWLEAVDDDFTKIFPDVGDGGG